MYPNEIDKFTEKLNKIDGNTYVIEEEVMLINGVYEVELRHDNVSNTSVRVYTGSKLTGDRIDNFILSTPSLTPWKKIIKIFSSNQKVYITYETQGDTVEADDINKVQESIVNTQIEVNRYKSSNDLEVSNLKVRATNLENNKAEKTYVDTELNKRYLKTETYTKTETDQRIQMVVNAAPAALDTLKELADALNNDPNFAATITTQLAGKVDKIVGKQLSTEDYTTTEKNKLAGIEAEANKYIHPSTHTASIIVQDSTHRFSSDTEKTNWNSAVEHIKDTVRHITKAERDSWNGKADISNIPTKVGQLENDKKYITQSELGNAGYGDMLKSTYDTDNDGIVDWAEKIEWSGVQNKPPTYPPSTHNHDTLYIQKNLAPVSDFNNALTEGEMQIASPTSLLNAPYPGNMYGKLRIYVSDGGTHNNSSNWIWQYFDDTSSGSYTRFKVNGSAWTAWRRIDAGAFAPSGYGLGTYLSTVSVTNSNDATMTGMYWVSSSDANKPPGVIADGLLIVLAHSSLWISQIYCDWQSNTYRRTKNNGVWSLWKKVATVNDGVTWNNLKGV
ncbi:pyocin knob domain-containing protein [Clostridium peptidivorans]|uniref:pyocin knob domain-containing protein n=1 Tax=Clostridium peptidivorans TaxID=100174 RepID=UPI001FA83531|nr:pyocin knob domain-containing protein [Clostridium peptidivorans]